MKTSWLVLFCSVTMAMAGRVQATEPAGTTFVRGFQGAPSGGFRQAWHTHLGMVPLLGVRQQKDCCEIAWTSAGAGEPDRRHGHVRLDRGHGSQAFAPG